MKRNFSSLPNRLNDTISVSLLLLLFGTFIFAQNNLSSQNTIKQSVAFNNEKSEVSRPRLVGTDSTTANVSISDKTEKTSIILVTSAAVINQMEKKAFEILNEKRRERGLPPVIWSEDMAKVARLHSENMAKFSFFSHAGLDGKMVSHRADSLGFSRWRAIGENIAYNHGYDNPVEFTCQRWMQSQSHRENILNPRWKEAGVGVAITTEGTYYFTEVFVVR